jgi:hypothetical protein
MANNQNANNNNQNQQQGSLLNRVANNKNTNNNQNQQTNNNNNNTPRSRFGNGNRFGNNRQPEKPTWTITPMRDAGIKIAFQGIGDPLFRILGRSLDKSLSDVKILVERLDGDDELCQQLITKLDEAWEVYDFRGAVMMHVVRKNIQEAFTLPIMPIVEPEPQEDTENTENADDNNGNLKTPQWLQLQSTPSPYKIYRAVDATFVLNILGRVRGNILVEDTPLALELGFLNQAYICDDTRIVELALATGAIEEI